ncbi:MAG TPA: LacI family DNA-binding transcriptional regulator [Fervidobacterium sp.]|nr:LacI family DNA-binding transcriptional regulator [Fervidobacterium sp.]
MAKTTRAFQKVTIKDVAKHANVGVGTVSRVLNNNSHVDPSTRQRVLSAIKELGYIPNPHARRLSTGTSDLITVITPEMKGDFYQMLMAAIDEVLIKNGYSSLLYPLYNEKKYEALRKSSEILLSTDGLIVDGVSVDKILGDIVEPNMPVVCLEQESEKYDSIMVDNYYGGIIAGDYFADFDMEIFVVTHRKAHELESTVFDERLEGFQESLERKGRAIDKIYYVPLDWESTFEVARRIFSRYQRCAIFTTTDYLALPIIEVARTVELKVGIDVRVCGFDDLPIAQVLDITTVKQPITEMGKLAAETLMKKIHGKARGKVRKVILKPELVIRET